MPWQELTLTHFSLQSECFVKNMAKEATITGVENLIIKISVSMTLFGHEVRITDLAICA